MPGRLLGLILVFLVSSYAVAAELPLTRVVAFNTGVAFFEHAGKVTGDQTVTLAFDAEDVNDVLKSLVLLDLDGGSATAVTYDNREPLARSLGGLSVDLSSNLTMADLLRQLRGQEIEVHEEFPQRGRIVGVERRATPLRDTSVERDHLLLNTSDGLRSIALDRIQTLKLVDKDLNADFQRGLELLAQSRSSQQKQVTLNFRGEGERRVVVGYIQEFPVWKTTYRLVLDEEKKPFLQGWAIVENTSDKDWSDVELSLVSGRPISFMMNLYEPLYVRRPTVMPDVVAGIGPRVYGQGFDADPFGSFDAGDLAGADKRMMERERSGRGTGGGGFGGFGGGGGFGGSMRRPQRAAQLSESLSQTSQAMGVGGEVGELFRYQIDQPVTLASEHSSMLPIITSEVDGEKLSIFNPAVHTEHPLSGYRLKNSSDLHLMAGPVAVFDGGEFAGDARLGDVGPGDERLISYALDLATEVVTRPIDGKREIASVKLNGLALVLTYAQTAGADYAVANSSDAERQVLIERPINAGWELLEPEEAKETTRDTRRFRVVVAADKTAKLRVVEQSRNKQIVPFVSMNDQQLAGYLETPGLSEQAANTLREYAARKERLADAENAFGDAINQLTTLSSDQDRLRKNMENLDRTSRLYQRFEQKMGEHETKLEQLRAMLTGLKQKVAELKKTLLDGLDRVDD